MRWVFAALGFVYGRFIGAIVGYWLGWMLEQANLRRRRPVRAQTGMRVDILQDFLTLAVAMARADGQLDAREVRSIRDFFERAMGFRGPALDWLKDALKVEANQPGDWQQAAFRLATMLTPLDLSMLQRVLVAVALADGRMGGSEQRLIADISRIWQIPAPDFSTPQTPRVNRKGRDWALKVFGLPTNASQDDIDRQYKKLVREKHPDRFAHLGEPFQSQAHEQFVEIQEAYRILQAA